jgi:regulator of sigma D
MLNNCQSALERWGGVNEIIDRWLQERQDLLVLFCKLTAQKDGNFPSESESMLQHFCQILVDYVSAGHFEVYERLANEGRELDDQEGLSKAKILYKTIDSTTELVLDFNDKYQETDDLSSLLQDLSRLGETLETRFEAEDSMIEVLHHSHRDQVV